MIPTKTYPLSAIIGNQLTDKERIAELADAFNRVCDENADFVAQSVTDEARIAELQDSFEDAVTRAEQAENSIAELEAELTMRREQAEGLQNQWVKDTQNIVKLEAQVKHCEGHAAELEAEVKTLRKSGIGLIGILEEIFYAISINKNCSERTRTAAATLEQRIKAVREGK